MKIQHVEWRSDDNLYRYALCSLKEVDGNTVKYIIKYGNSFTVNSGIDNDGVLLRVKKWLVDNVLGGVFTRIEFIGIPMELDKMTLSFTIN